eukprot:1698503-Amphidinium_carterae.1
MANCGELTCREFFALSFAAQVFFIQLCVPTAVLVEKWMDPQNRLKETDIWKHLNIHELLCLGKDIEVALVPWEY